MPYLVGGEINHHFLALYTREESYLAVGLGDDAIGLAALVVELQRSLIYGHGLRCGGHQHKGWILHRYAASGSEGADAVSNGGGGNLDDVCLHLGTYSGSAEEVTLDGEGGGAVAEGFVERELIAVAIGGNSCAYLCVALVELQRGGINGTLVLRQPEPDASNIVGIHNAFGGDISIGQNHALLGGGDCHHAVIVAAGTGDRHVLQLDSFYCSLPAFTILSIDIDKTYSHAAIGCS